jgi:AAA+ superfamily predicted ATPase
LFIVQTIRLDDGARDESSRTLGAGMSAALSCRMATSFAYELRRLSSLLIAGETHAPGTLAIELAKAFELSPIEIDIALLVLGIELDAELARLFAAAAESPIVTELSVLAALVPALETRLALRPAIGSECALVRRRILRRLDDGRLQVTRRFRAGVLQRELMAELPDYARRISGEPVELAWVQSPRALAAAMHRRGPPGALCVVTGASGTGKTSWARSLALSMSRPALAVDLAAAAATGRHVAGEIRELLEDAALEGYAVVIDNAQGLVRGGTRFASMFADVLDEVAVQAVLVVEDASELDPRLVGRALSRVRIDHPPAAIRKQLWRAARLPDEQANLLAEDLVLSPRQIANASVLVDAGGIDPLVAAVEQLPVRCALTIPDRATAKLDALILPSDTRDEIVEVIGAIRARWVVQHGWGLVRGTRGRAVSALFDGDSGTGKTLACEVIAAEVGLPLMRVNVATLVDKYVGETEKNLTRVFDEAKAHGGILFFDEADALFGSRTDGGRAQDRYANLATNLLLQLMEDFAGIVLLTTNLKRNIDQAFMRRITFKVYFESPEPAERERLWRMNIPDGARVDTHRLATAFELTGGSIRAAALRAAYRAAAASRDVEMVDLIECAKLEAAGMGRVATFQ